MSDHKTERFVARCHDGEAVVVDTKRHMMYRGFESMRFARENAANRNAREPKRKRT